MEFENYYFNISFFVILFLFLEFVHLKLMTNVRICNYQFQMYKFTQPIRYRQANF